MAELEKMTEPQVNEKLYTVLVSGSIVSHTVTTLVASVHTATISVHVASVHTTTAINSQSSVWSTVLVHYYTQLGPPTHVENFFI